MTGLWVGKKVRLRLPRPEDAALLAQTADDTERDRLSWEVRYPFSPERHRRRVEKAIEAGEDPGDNRQLMIETLAGELVGSINLHGSHPRHRTAEIGLGLRSQAYEGQGYASEATRLLLRYVSANWTMPRLISKSTPSTPAPSRSTSTWASATRAASAA